MLTESQGCRALQPIAHHCKKLAWMSRAGEMSDFDLLEMKFLVRDPGSGIKVEGVIVVRVSCVVVEIITLSVRIFKKLRRLISRALPMTKSSLIQDAAIDIV